MLMSILISCNLHAAWTTTVRHQDIVYFFDYSAQIHRYDLENNNWLTSLTLSDVPTTGWVDESAIFVAYDKALYELEFNGANESHVRNFTNTIEAIFTDNNLLIVNYSDYSYVRASSFEKSTGTLLYDHESYTHTSFGASIAPGINKMFGRKISGSPTDIVMTTYEDSGAIISSISSPHHGDYPSASKTWVFPNEMRVVDDSGTVYSTDTLTYTGSFGLSFTDVSFYGDSLPVVISDSQIIGLNGGYLPTGYIELTFIPEEIQIHAESIFLFTSDATQPKGIRIDQFQIADLSLPDPGEPIDPTTVQVDPDAIFVDKHGIINLFSRQSVSLFRWNPETFSWLETKPLPNDPKFIAYDEANHQLFCALDSGLVTKLDLSLELPTAVPYANLPTAPLGMAVAGDHLFTVDSSGAWETHRVFRISDGQELSSSDWSNTSDQYYWESTRRRMYYFRDDTSPNDIMYREISSSGVLGNQVDSIYHGDYSFVHPIRFFPDRSRILTGSGVIFNAGDLNYNSTLTNWIYDAAWLDGYIFTLRRESTYNSTPPSSTTLQRWSGTLAIELDTVVAGAPEALLTIGDRLILVVSYEGALRFMAYDSDLNLTDISDLGGSANGPVTPVDTNGLIALTWDPSSFHSNDVLQIEELSLGNGEWSIVGTADASSGSFSIGSLEDGSVHDYRIKTLPRQQTTPLGIELTVDHQFSHSWDPPEDNTTFSPFYRFDANDEWTPLDTIYSGYGRIVIENVATFQYPEVELRYETETISELAPENVIESGTVHFNWLRSHYDESGYFLSYMDEFNNLEIIATYGQDVFTASFPRVELPNDLNRYRMFVVRNENFYQHNLQVSVEINLNWTDLLSPPLHYRVEISPYPGLWSPVETVAPDATGYLFKATSINQYPALRVIRKEGSEILHYVEGLTSTFTTYLSWPSGLVSSGTLSLEWRDSPEGDWNLDPNSFNYYTTNVQRIYESPNARDYRLTSAETIDESIVAYLTVYKPAPIDLASYEIEEMYLVTLSPNSMGIWIKTDQGLSYTLQKSSDLSSWTDVDSSFEGSDSLEFLDIATDPESTGFYRFVVRNSN
jgi:hypothetical protein